jgi:hypothetical protein
MCSHGRIAVQPFLERHGLRACMLAPTKIIAGLGMSLGVDRLTAPGATGAARRLCLCRWSTRGGCLLASTGFADPC